jgi:poly(hydroxyalkanoate) depolymerase family esterase
MEQGRSEGRRLAGLTTKASGIWARLRIVVAALVAAGVVLVPGAAKAAAGTLGSGDFSGAAGTIHYELYVPSSYSPSTPVPLVVALHGCGQTADGFRALTHWDMLGESKGFIVLLPQQDNSNNPLGCWNFFQDASMHRGAGDPARIAAVTSLIENSYNVDPHRVYVTGLSAGGAMASVMGATYPDYYAAIGIGSGCEYAATATCAGYQSADPAQASQAAYKEMGPRARPMPFVAFQGSSDTTVPPVNGQQLVQQWLATDDLADDGSANGSVSTSPMKQTPGFSSGGQYYTVNSYGDRNKAELGEYWLINGMNHAWSGGDASQSFSDPSGPDETGSMYTFFAAHPAMSLTRPAPPARNSSAGGGSKPGSGGGSKAPRRSVPKVSKLSLAHGRIAFTVSGPGRVTVRLQRRVVGHLRHGHCVAGKGKRRCTAYSTRAKIVRTVKKAGRVVIARSRMMHGRRLAAGRYRVLVTPSDGAGHRGTSRSRTLVMR